MINIVPLTKTAFSHMSFTHLYVLPALYRLLFLNTRFVIQALQCNKSRFCKFVVKM